MKNEREKQIKENEKLPAFPPMVAQDSLGRILAPLPGMSKLEFFALQLLPFYLKLQITKHLEDKGKPVTAFQAAKIAAREMIAELAEPNEIQANDAGMRIIQ